MLALLLVGASLITNSGLFFGGLARKKLILTYLGDQAALQRAVTVWWVLGALIVAGLLIHHRWPVAGLVLVGIGGVGHHLDYRIGFQPLDLAVPIVLYALASTTRARWVSAVALGVLLTAEFAVNLRAPVTPVGKFVSVKPVIPPATNESVNAMLVSAASRSLQFALLLGLAAALGDAVRSRRLHLHLLEQRAIDLEREQQQRAALAAAAERARLTRELHDVVAHGLSVIVVQAQGAAAALTRHPDRAASALQHVISTGRRSLAEMRGLLGVVGRDDPDGDAQPTVVPGVGALADLVDRVRAAGLSVRLRIDGEPVPLPASVDLSAYRIVQEALTNALKHAGPGTNVEVGLTFAADTIAVEITDDGPGATEPSLDGKGLRGIAERVGLLGGEFEAGPAGPSGFRVSARLPIEVAQ